MDGKQAVLLLLLGWLGERSLCDDQCPNSCYCDGKNEFVSCVSDGQWGGLPNLPKTSTRLELKNYEVRVLSIANLDGLEVLKELKLQVNLESIEDKAFTKLDGLLKLDLSQNSLVNITSETFQGLRNLRHLDLSSNMLLCIEEAFVSVSKLEQLNLKSNQLFNLTTRTFIGLINLQYLNLDDNKVANIEVGTFQNLRNLAHLILSNNPLVTLSRLDFLSPRLQYMDMSHAGLEKVPTSLSKFIRDLRLAKNNITSIKKGDFDNYLYMGLLVLDDNVITDVEDGTWRRHEYLLRIWLNGNRLLKIPSNLPTSMKALYLEENLIPDIPNYSFHDLINLEQLFLQRNKIQNISICGFCGLRNLNVLDLQANFIQTIPEGLFSNLTALELLDLSQNNIQKIEGGGFLGLRSLLKLHISRINNDISFNENIFDYLKNLETLEMYDNSKLAKQVLNSSHALRSLQNLKILNIMRNDITELHEDFPSFLPHLQVLKITENKWHCTVDIFWLSRWIKTATSMFIDAHNILCASPPELEKTPLISLTEDYFSTKSQLDTTYTESLSGLTSVISVKPNEASTKQSLVENKVTTLHDKTIQVNNRIPYIITRVDEVELNPIDNISESTKIFTFWEYQLSNPPLLEEVNTTQSTAEILVTIINTSSTNTVSKITLNKSRIDWANNIILIASSVSVCLIVLIAILIAGIMYRRNKKHKTNLCNTSRSSSIAYCPHKDEVLTAFDRTNDADDMCHGVGNKLYYITDNA